MPREFSDIHDLSKRITAQKLALEQLQADLDDFKSAQTIIEYTDYVGTVVTSTLNDFVWFYLTGHSIVVPPGLWDIDYSVTVQVISPATERLLNYATVMNYYYGDGVKAIHQETHPEFTCATDYNMTSTPAYMLEATQMPFYKKRRFLLTSTTTWYLCIAGNRPTGGVITGLRTNGDVAVTFLRATRVKFGE